MKPLGDEMFSIEDCGDTVELVARWPTELLRSDVVEVRDWLNDWLRVKDSVG